MNKFVGRRVAIVAAGSASGEQGGAERFYQGLLAAVKAAGCDAELITVAADESSFEAIQQNYARCEELDLSAFDMVISTKGPTYVVRHPRHVLYLVHTTRVFYDMFDEAFPTASTHHQRQRAWILNRDSEAFARINGRFAIGGEVAGRLRRWNGIDASVLHPPLATNSFRHGESGDYFFLPGRLHAWKRVDLVISALKTSSLPNKLLIAGTGEAEQSLRELAGGDPRIVFLGRISDEELVDYYANCLAVPFVPKREDYGYVTLEAFASGKPVITCSDSGEPVRFVRHGRTGAVCDPSVGGVRSGLEFIAESRQAAREMGLRGYNETKDLCWEAIADKLLSAGFSDAPAKPSESEAMKVAVLDMQPIDPPVGGGRLRLLGLYHDLGCNVKTRYVGSYDWPGETRRQHKLTPTLEEIDVPLSTAHHEAARELSVQAGGKTVIDIAFSLQAHLSPEYCAAACDAVEWADVVVFSHPWVYPLVTDRLQPHQLVVYDSQNVEGLLRTQILGDQNPAIALLLRNVVKTESECGSRADLVLCCSQEDLNLFERIYDWPAHKMRVVANGVMTSAIAPPTAEERAAARRRLGISLGGDVAIFLGSNYLPNVEAANFIIQELAPKAPGITFTIAGGVGSNLQHFQSENVRVTGPISEEQKRDWLLASDLAVNPMFSGSGTNIKMFDFMAAGLPTVTTDTGARGIEVAGRQPMLVVGQSAHDFVSAFEVLRGRDAREEMQNAARRCVEEGYAWERISPLLGMMLTVRSSFVGNPPPFFSVVIPSYERHDQLDALMSRLQRQIERDFEVVIVDQSAARWPRASKEFGFPLTYYHSPVKGAVRARNVGAMLARGRVIAFTDDDCLPEEDWLLNGKKYFDVDDVVGVEGMITSDHLGEADWRPVTNVGFEGIGFMTANLMVRTSVFQKIGGFDLQFDRPHFREDTDFGWRMQDLGEVPYARDVTVFHPAQPRELERESSAARLQFFRKDALLFMKHPERYKELFIIERQYEVTPGFVGQLLAGFTANGTQPPEWMAQYLSAPSMVLQQS